MRFVIKDVYGDIYCGTEDLESDEEMKETLDNLAVKLYSGQLAYLSLTIDGNVKYFNPKNIIWFGLE